MDAFRVCSSKSSNSDANSSRSSSISEASWSADDDLSSRMSITDLLAAAEFLERSERQKDGAAKRPMGMMCPVSLMAAVKSSSDLEADLISAKKRRILPLIVSNSFLQQNSNASKPISPALDANLQNVGSGIATRASHNELEKNRRAHLRTCLEKLKDLIPINSEGSRCTTLSLLTKATMYIKSLEEQKAKVKAEKEALLQEQERLKKQLEQAKASKSSTDRSFSSGDLEADFTLSSNVPLLSRPVSMPYRMAASRHNVADSANYEDVIIVPQRSRSPSECSASTLSADEADERKDNLKTDHDDEEETAPDFTVSPPSPNCLKSVVCSELQSVCCQRSSAVVDVAPSVSPCALQFLTTFVPTVVTDCTPTTSTAVNSTPAAAARGDADFGTTRACFVKNDYFPSLASSSTTFQPSTVTTSLPRFVVPPCIMTFDHEKALEAATPFSSTATIDSDTPALAAPSSRQKSDDSSAVDFLYEPLFGRLTLQTLLDQYSRACASTFSSRQDGGRCWAGDDNEKLVSSAYVKNNTTMAVPQIIMQL